MSRIEAGQRSNLFTLPWEDVAADAAGLATDVAHRSGVPRDRLENKQSKAATLRSCSAIARQTFDQKLKSIHERQSAAVKIRDRRPKRYKDRSGRWRIRRPSPSAKRSLSDNCAGVARISLARLLGLLPSGVTYHGLARAVKRDVDALDARIGRLPASSPERASLLKKRSKLIESQHTALHGIRNAKHVKAFNALWKRLGGASGVKAVRTYATTDRPRAANRKAMFALLRRGVPMAVSLHACNTSGKIISANWHHVLLVPNPCNSKQVYVVDPWTGSSIKTVSLRALMSSGKKGFLGLASRKKCVLGSFFLHFTQSDGTPLKVKP